MQIRGLAVLLLVLTVVLLGPGATLRAEGGQAAVVVEFGDGYRVVRVVDFSTPTISGMDLLRLSGLDASIVGGQVCRIGPDGCAFPLVSCWCAAPYFWNYFNWSGSHWLFACQGAAGRTVADGDVDAWLWGNGVTPKPLDAAALFDESRLAPGVPNAVVDSSGVVRLSVEVAGDADHDGTLSARFRPTAGAWSQPLPLQRSADVCTLSIPALAAGTYEVELLFGDADGVNGSTTWQTALNVATAQSEHTYLPVVTGPRAE